MDVRGLIPDAQKPGQAPQAQALWYGKVVKPLPVVLTDPMWVVIPDIHPHQVFGPCHWPVGIVPAIGKEALVVFDNRQQAWVVALW